MALTDDQLRDDQLRNGIAGPGVNAGLGSIPDPLPDYISEEIAAYCSVMRYGPHDPTAGQRPVPARVGKLTAPFELDMIGQTFGPGRYTLQWHDKRHQYLGRSEITVGAAPPAAPPAWNQAPAAPQPRNFPANPNENPYYPPAYAPQPGPLDLVLARLAQLEARLSAAPAAPVAPAAPALTVQDMLSMFTAAATILKPADPDLMAKYFTTGMRLAREAGGASSSRGDDGGGGWAQVIASLGPQLLETLNRMVPPAAVAATPALAAGASAPPAAAGNGAAPQGAGQVPKWLQQLIEELQRGIATDDDPEYTADWIVRNVPPPFVKQLCEPEEIVLAKLATYEAIVPELGTDQGRAYCKAVMAALREDQLGEVGGAEGATAKV